MKQHPESSTNGELCKILRVQEGRETEPSLAIIDSQSVKSTRTELHQFKVMPKRWVVERTIGWMNNFRGLSKHYDYDSKTGESKIYLASIFLHEEKS